MSRGADIHARNISKEKEKAALIFKEICPTEVERRTRKEFLEETQIQIEVCYGLCRKLNENQMRELLISKTLLELERKARNFKFA